LSDKCKIRDNNKAYFITSTVVGWVDVFTRPNHKMLIVKSLGHCIKNKGLTIYAWCLMSSHLHLICRAKEGFHLSDILRDFKSYTSKKIIEQIKNEPESRREWMLDYFLKACEHLKTGQKYKLWQDGNHSEEIFSNSFLYEKLDYLHNNPVKEMIVENAWDYLYSSARNYADKEGLLDVCVLGHKPLISNWK
jgi:putative transposase